MADYIAGLRAEIYDALDRGRMDDYRDLSLMLADHYEDEGRQERADHRRRRANVMRPAGVKWPMPCMIDGLSDHQRGELEKATSRRLGVLAGTPGTGKTYCVGALVNHMLTSGGIPFNTVALCAPTGKAAVRMTAAIRDTLAVRNSAGEAFDPQPTWDGQVQMAATTIHQLLEIGRNGHDGRGWGFRRNKNNTLPERFVIVDEASMLDTDLADALVSALHPQAHILFVGDPHQLPPVGHGAPLRDMIASGKVACGTLSEIRRNAGMIVRACARVKDGKRFEVATYDEPGNLTLIEAKTPEEQSRAVMKIIDANGDDDTQTICAVNKGSFVARADLNTTIQRHVHKGAIMGHPPYMVGDKVICLKNGTYEASPYLSDEGGMAYVANGEMGEVMSTTERSCGVRFTDPTRHVLVPFPAKQQHDDGADPDAPPQSSPQAFALGYASTCHKSQGSEWPVVIVVLDASYGAQQILTREWLYTAISRASQHCYLVGTQATIDAALSRTELGKRRTRLVELLRRANTDGTSQTS